MKPSVFSLYDTETSSLNKAHGQVYQFAGFKVDQDLNVIPGTELVVDIKPRPDVVPGPVAFSIHGISIVSLLQNGINEWEAAGKIRDWLMETQYGPSMTVGFNSQRFDDEVLRNMFYRTMIDPYEHEWRNGNSRGDVMRLVMLAFALRPETLRWPVNQADGRFSLKLGDLCAENGITLDHAHDARFDVLATLELMREVKKNNQKIFDYFLKVSDKQFVTEMVLKLQPLAVVNSFFPREQGHLSVMLPIIMDSENKNKMWCVDLREDPTELLSLEPAEINRRMFTKVNDLGEGEGLNSIRDISLNKQPLVCPLGIFTGRDDVRERAGLDIERCLKHAEMIKADKGFRARLQTAMKSDFAPCEDVYEGIYSLGMFGNDEQKLRSSMRRLVTVEGLEGPQPQIVKIDPHQLATHNARDRLRAFELALRAKWANHGEKVIALNQFSKEELSEWVKHLENAWFKESPPKDAHNLKLYSEELTKVFASTAMTPEQERAIQEMEVFVEQNLAMIESLKELCVELHSQVPESEAARSEVNMIEADRKGREARHNVTGVDYQP